MITVKIDHVLNKEMKAYHLNDNAYQLVVFEDRKYRKHQIRKQNILITTFLNTWFEKSDRITRKMFLQNSFFFYILSFTSSDENCILGFRNSITNY